MTSTGLTVTQDDIDELVYGAAVLGTGGGGDPYLGRLILHQELEESGCVELLDPQDLCDEAHVAAIGVVGAPVVLLERFPNLKSFQKCVDTIEMLTGRRIDAVIPSEAGGLNGTLPIVIGKSLGLPTIDGDGMGRAFPEGQMMTFGIYGGRLGPMVIVDDHLNTAIIDSNENSTTEHIGRGVVDRMKGLGMAAVYPMSGSHVKKTAVRRSLTNALEIGRSVFAARRGRRDPVDALVKHFTNLPGKARFAKLLFRGKIARLPIETEGGFTHGRIELVGFEKGETSCTIVFQNENLSVQIDDKVVALVPDLIIIVDLDRAEPITTENLRFGQRVAVLGIAAPDLLRTPEALAVVGPRCFGLDYDYTRLEDF